jgi:hypothetical protein
MRIMYQKKTALITGATSGIGLALAKKMITEGYSLILVSSSKERLQKTVKSLKRLARQQLADNTSSADAGSKPLCRVDIICQDLSVPKAAQNVYCQVKGKKLHVDILINNAGFGLMGEAVENDMEREEAMLRLQIQTTTQLCEFFLRDMYRQGSGKILNVASVGAFQPGPYTASYYAGKAYLSSYSRAIRYEAAGKGVQVCTLYPGTTRTKFFAKAGAKTPFWAMSADKAAQIAYNGLMKNKEMIIPGITNQLLRFVPASIKVRGVAFLKKAKK